MAKWSPEDIALAEKTIPTEKDPAKRAALMQRYAAETAMPGVPQDGSALPGPEVAKAGAPTAPPEEKITPGAQATQDDLKALADATQAHIDSQAPHKDKKPVVIPHAPVAGEGDQVNWFDPEPPPGQQGGIDAENFKNAAWNEAVKKAPPGVMLVRTDVTNGKDFGYGALRKASQFAQGFNEATLVGPAARLLDAPFSSPERRAVDADQLALAESSPAGLAGNIAGTFAPGGPTSMIAGEAKTLGNKLLGGAVKEGDKMLLRLGRSLVEGSLGIGGQTLVEHGLEAGSDLARGDEVTSLPDWRGGGQLPGLQPFMDDLGARLTVGLPMGLAAEGLGGMARSMSAVPRQNASTKGTALNRLEDSEGRRMTNAGVNAFRKPTEGSQFIQTGGKVDASQLADEAAARPIARHLSDQSADVLETLRRAGDDALAGVKGIDAGANQWSEALAEKAVPMAINRSSQGKAATAVAKEAYFASPEGLEKISVESIIPTILKEIDAGKLDDGTPIPFDTRASLKTTVLNKLMDAAEEAPPAERTGGARLLDETFGEADSLVPTEAPRTPKFINARELDGIMKSLSTEAKSGVIGSPSMEKQALDPLLNGLSALRREHFPGLEAIKEEAQASISSLNRQTQALGLPPGYANAAGEDRLAALREGVTPKLKAIFSGEHRGMAPELQAKNYQEVQNFFKSDPEAFAFYKTTIALQHTRDDLLALTGGVGANATQPASLAARERLAEGITSDGSAQVLASSLRQRGYPDVANKVDAAAKRFQALDQKIRAAKLPTGKDGMEKLYANSMDEALKLVKRYGDEGSERQLIEALGQPPEEAAKTLSALSQAVSVRAWKELQSGGELRGRLAGNDRGIAPYLATTGDALLYRLDPLMSQLGGRFELRSGKSATVGDIGLYGRGGNAATKGTAAMNPKNAADVGHWVQKQFNNLYDWTSDQLADTAPTTPAP